MLAVAVLACYSVSLGLGLGRSRLGLDTASSLWDTAVLVLIWILNNWTQATSDAFTIFIQLGNTIMSISSWNLFKSPVLSVLIIRSADCKAKINSCEIVIFNLPNGFRTKDTITLYIPWLSNRALHNISYRHNMVFLFCNLLVVLKNWKRASCAI